MMAPKCPYSISASANKGKGFFFLIMYWKSRKGKSKYNFRCILSVIFNTFMRTSNSFKDAINLYCKSSSSSFKYDNLYLWYRYVRWQGEQNLHVQKFLIIKGFVSCLLWKEFRHVKFVILIVCSLKTSKIWPIYLANKKVQIRILYYFVVLF